VNIDDLIIYTVNTYDIGTNNDDVDAKASESTDMLDVVLLGVTVAIFLSQNRNQTSERIKK
jgi:hypothetical protein